MAPLLAAVWFLSPYPLWHAPSDSSSALSVWVVCHLSRTLHPKKPWQEPQNRFFPLSTTKPCPLTHDLTMSYIGWIQAGEVWALRVPSFHMCPKSVYRLLVRRSLEACLHSLPSVFWPFMWVAFWFPASFRGWAVIVIGLYTSFDPFFDCPHFLPCHSVIPAVMTQFCWAPLGLPFILSPSGLIWPLVFLLIGSCVPFIFLLGILDPFASFGFPNPF